MKKRLNRVLALVLFVAMALAWIPARVAAAASPRYPVIFVPGIAGTQLYNQSQLVWIDPMRLAESQLPVLSLFQMDWLLPLRLAADGRTPLQPGYQIHTGDILQHGSVDAYSGMLTMLKNQGYVMGKDLRVLPYDWRLSPSVAAGQLRRLVNETLAATGAHKVILIGHSLGGLVVRDYVVGGGAGKVEATISLATPWLGAPVAYQALQYGWDLGLRLPGIKWPAFSPDDIRLLVQNYPSVYMLAPGRHYFDWYPGGYLQRGGQPLSFAATVAQGLAPHNAALAALVPAYEDRLLDGSNHGVLQFVLAGTGSQTVDEFTENRDWFGMTEVTKGYTDGDGVVPVRSADLGYSVNRQAVQRYIGKVQAVAYASQPHALFAQSPVVEAIVQGWLQQIQTR